MQEKHRTSFSNIKTGFTIVELLVGIVVIAILVAITVVAYIGVTNNANKASVISDLDSDAKLLRMYDVDYDSYPTSSNCR